MKDQFENTVEVKSDDNFRKKAGILFAGIAGMSSILGFALTLAAVKKVNSKYLKEGITPVPKLPESGVNLAVRALCLGTLYAWTGCGLLFYGIWKLSGAKNFQEFRYKVGSVLPRISKNSPHQGRTEFDGIEDLLEYLQMESVKDK